ncbi:MAG: T9SS type A sorting domain-containing protein, partial [Bacteroidota bacterium]
PAFAQLRAYPNPATRYLALSGGPENAEYEVINVQGQTLLRGAHNQKSRIDVASLSEGVYFVKLTSDTGTAVERFIKQ